MFHLRYNSAMSKTQGPLGQVISASEAAEILKRDPTLVRRYCREGRFDRDGQAGAKKLDGEWAIWRPYVVAFARRKRKAGRPKGLK